MKRLRKYLLRTLPPVLFVLAIAAPAQADRTAPTPAQALHCMDIGADHWLEQLPSDLIVREASGVAPWTLVHANNRIYGVIWRQYSIAGARYNQNRQMRAWTEEGHIGCTWRDSPVQTLKGYSPYNPNWLG